MARHPSGALGSKVKKERAKEARQRIYDGVYIKFPADLRTKCEALFKRIGYEEKQGYETLVRIGLNKMDDKEVALLEMRKDYMTEPEFVASFPQHFASYLTQSGQIASENRDGVKWYSRPEVWALVKKYKKVAKP